MFLERLFGLGIGLGPGLGCVDDDVFDGLSAAGTGNEVFRVRVVYVLVCSGLALQ